MRFLSLILIALTGAQLGVGAMKDQNNNSGRAAFMRAMHETKINNQDRQDELSARLLYRAMPLTSEYARRLGDDYNDNAYDDDNIVNGGINITKYAIKYLGCQNIHTFDGDLAEDEDSKSPLAMDRFAILRLCPKDSCSNYNKWGCNAEFSDFIVTLEDYLQAMSTYYVSEYQEYCETCRKCMKAQNLNEAAAAAAVSDAADAYDAYDAYDAGDANDAADGYDAYDYGYDAADQVDYNDAANGGYQYGDDAYMNDDGTCQYYDICEDYKNVCKDYSRKASNYEGYFQCMAFNVGNNVGYLGPHCRSDGHTIGIGIYDDEGCNDYIGDLVDIGAYTGMDFSDSYIKSYYSSSCMSCLDSEGYSLYTDDEQGAVVSGICGALYDGSAQCNKYMGTESAYTSLQQEENEGTVCTFITNLIHNTYDEYGEIVLESGFNWRAFVPTPSEMTTFQKIAVPFSILLVLCLSMYAAHLHRIIVSRRFQYQDSAQLQILSAGSAASFEAGKMSRMHSGIVQGRSRSSLSSRGSGRLA